MTVTIQQYLRWIVGIESAPSGFTSIFGQDEPNGRLPFLYEPPKAEVRSGESSVLTAANAHTASIEAAVYVIIEGDRFDKSVRPPLVASLLFVVCSHTIRVLPCEALAAYV